MNDGIKFTDIEISTENSELSSGNLKGHDVEIDGGEFKMDAAGGSVAMQQNQKDFEEYVKRPFEGKLTLDEPVSVTIVILMVVMLRKGIWREFGKKQK